MSRSQLGICLVLVMLVVTGSAGILRATCTFGCFKFDWYSEGSQDWHTSANVCIEYANVNGNGAVCYQTMTNLGGVCGGLAQVTRWAADPYRCCADAMHKGHNQPTTTFGSGTTEFLPNQCQNSI